MIADAGANLRAYWTLDDPSIWNNWTAADIASSPAATKYAPGGGTTLGASSPIRDGSGHAMTLGAAGGVSMNTPALVKVQPTASFTVEAWFKTSATPPAAYPIFCSNNCNGGIQLLLLANGKLSI